MSVGCAVVIGKFLPPHRGHAHLIDTALAGADDVTVIVCGKPSDPIPADRRAGWLRELHPGAHVMVIDDRYDEDDTEVWARNTIEWLGGAPDVVYTSEAYGVPYARAMGCAHVLVDRSRTAVPISGTQVRADPYASWRYIAAPVRAWYARRVCVIGAESTGTSTLASALAAHYRTPWVEEYGREYSIAKQARGETDWTSDEFVEIAHEQTWRADQAARDANRVLIEDTNAFATVHWHRRYMGADSDDVAAEAARARCDLYLLTGDEIPFVQDGLRDGEHLRHEMHDGFVAALQAQAVPWRLLLGPHERRMADATAAIDALFEGSAWRPGMP